LSKLELRWLDKLSKAADTLPVNEQEFIALMTPKVDTAKVHLEEYLN
jgi:hypothetical protein